MISTAAVWMWLRIKCYKRSRSKRQVSTLSVALAWVEPSAAEVDLNGQLWSSSSIQLVLIIKQLPKWRQASSLIKKMSRVKQTGKRKRTRYSWSAVVNTTWPPPTSAKLKANNKSHNGTTAVSRPMLSKQSNRTLSLRRQRSRYRGWNSLHSKLKSKMKTCPWWRWLLVTEGRQRTLTAWLTWNHHQLAGWWT